MRKALKSGGHALIAAFSLLGPAKCSGLDVERYSKEKMAGELGEDFEFKKSVEEVHLTPWKAEQRFIYCYFRKR